MLAGMELDMFQGIYSGSGRARWSNERSGEHVSVAGWETVAIHRHSRKQQALATGAQQARRCLTCKVEVLGHVLTPRRGGQEGAPGGRQGVGAD